MTIHAARQTMQTLNASMEALAALGAALNLAAGQQSRCGDFQPYPQCGRYPGRRLA